MSLNGTRRHENALLQKSVVARRFQIAQAEYAENLEIRRKKLKEILEKEDEEFSYFHEKLLKEKEKARKEALIKESENLQDLIIERNSKVAEIKYAELFNRNNREYRDCKPQIFNAILKEDQDAIIKSKELRKIYEKGRDFQSFQLGYNYFKKMLSDEDYRNKDKHIRAKIQEDELIKQIAEREELKMGTKSREETECKNLDGSLQKENEHEMKKECERKQKLWCDLKSQLEEVRNRMKEEKDLDKAINKSISDCWLSAGKQNSKEKDINIFKCQMKSFNDYQEQLRNYRNKEDIEAERLILETAEKLRLERSGKERVRRCKLQELEREVHELNKQAALEKDAKSRVKNFTEGLCSDQQEIEKFEKQAKALEEAKRAELRKDLEKQIEELRLRKDEGKIQNSAVEWSVWGSKNTCSKVNLGVYRLHPWRLRNLKKMD